VTCSKFYLVNVTIPAFVYTGFSYPCSFSLLNVRNICLRNNAAVGFVSLKTSEVHLQLPYDGAYPSRVTNCTVTSPSLFHFLYHVLISCFRYLSSSSFEFLSHSLLKGAPIAHCVYFF